MKTILWLFYKRYLSKQKRQLKNIDIIAYWLYNVMYKEMRFSVNIGLNRSNKIMAGLLIGAVLIFVCLVLFVGTSVSINKAYAAEVLSPTIDIQPVGITGVYRADLALSVTVSHIDENVTLEYEWYKVVVDSDDLLVGTEMDYPIRGTSYNGSYYCAIVARDTNNDISEPVTTNTVTVNLLKIPLRATINNTESFYGEAVAPLSFTLTQGSLVNGDAQEDLGVVLTKSAGNNVGNYNINGTNSAENYYIMFTKGIYTIKPKKIDIIVANQTSVYGESIKGLSFDLYGGSTLAYDDTKEGLNITLTKATGTNAGRYSISGYCGNPNYEANFIMGLYTISKRPVSINFEKHTDLVYNGEIQSISCSLLGSLLPNEEANVYIVYNKTPKNAGTYIATAVVDNNNYGIILGDQKTFSIAKKALKITLNDIVINVGQKPTFTYTYAGFVDGESAKDLLTLPEVVGAQEHTEVGDYDLMPSKATSNNYVITFEKGTLRINKTKIDSLVGLEGSASGSFSPSTTINVSANPSHTFSKFGSVIGGSYRVEINGVCYSETYKISVDDVYLSSIFMRVVVIDKDGVMRSPRSFEYKDGKLTVETTVPGTIIVYNDYLPIAVIGLTAIIIALGVLAFLVKDRRQAKFARDLAQATMEEADYFRDNE